jgi:hypothetical protein
MTLGIGAFNAFVECCYAECRLCLVSNYIMSSVIILSGVMLNVAAPSA